MPEVLYTNVIRTAKLAMRVLGQPIDITGLEYLPRTGPALLALNHIGYVDFIYGGFAPDRIGRRVRFMAKRELFDHKVTGPIMRACRHIMVDRAEGEASLAAALQFLGEGELVGIFPEATISRSMEIKELKTGAVRIAATASVPLIPMVLWGTQRMLTKDHDRDLSRGTAITIRIGEPIAVTGADPSGDTGRLRTAMQRLLVESIAAYPQHEPGAWWVPAAHGGSAPTPERAAQLDAEERRRRAQRSAQQKSAASEGDRSRR
jgi:1-acyl-sn-glycerol-3-phosphate acyltransferase